VAAADGSAVRRLASNLHNPGTPSWSFDDKWVALSHTGGVWVANVGGGGYPADPGERAYGVGASFAPRADDLLISASVPACPGHLGIREVTRATVRTLTGSCQIVGTSKGDFMEGTPLWGDVIKGLAGNDQIHANDGHTDTVNCGPGRDTVWADRTDKLTACEIVHR
jgi:hypothetical protein